MTTLGTLAHRAEIYAKELKSFEVFEHVATPIDHNHYVGHVISDGTHTVIGLEIVHEATLNAGDLYVPFMALDSWALGEFAPYQR